MRPGTGASMGYHCTKVLATYQSSRLLSSHTRVDTYECVCWGLCRHIRSMQQQCGWQEPYAKRPHAERSHARVHLIYDTVSTCSGMYIHVLLVSRTQRSRQAIQNDVGKTKSVSFCRLTHFVSRSCSCCDSHLISIQYGIPRTSHAIPRFHGTPPTFRGIPRFPTDLPRYPTVCISATSRSVLRTVSHRPPTVSHRIPTVFQDIPLYPYVF